jgi:hypothetical protein
MTLTDYLLAFFTVVGFLSSLTLVFGCVWAIYDAHRQDRRRRSIERDISASPVLSDAISDSVRLRVCEGPAHVYRLSDWSRGGECG